MSKTVKELRPADLSKVIDNGVLMELNRTVLHPLGLTLAVETRDGQRTTQLFETDDPEGIRYRTDVPEDITKVIEERQAKFDALKEEKAQARQVRTGEVVQERIVK